MSWESRVVTKRPVLFCVQVGDEIVPLNASTVERSITKRNTVGMFGHCHVSHMPAPRAHFEEAVSRVEQHTHLGVPFFNECPFTPAEIQFAHEQRWFHIVRTPGGCAVVSSVMLLDGEYDLADVDVRVSASKRAVYVRDGGRCAFCGRELSYGRATLDHVVPKSRVFWDGVASGEISLQDRGGPSRHDGFALDNLVLACWGCNQRKADRTPEEADMKLLTEPYEPDSVEEMIRLAIKAEIGVFEIPSSWEFYF